MVTNPLPMNGEMKSSVHSYSLSALAGGVNAILNYPYAILHTQVKMQIIAEGKDPTIGMSHSTEKYRDALVLDQMEPLRPVVDREILRFVLDSTMNPGDFTITNEGFCKLNPQLARTIVMLTSSVIAK
jgi:CRISP-associated protein Cas1